MNPEHPTYEDLNLLVQVSQLLTETDLESVLNKVIELTRQYVGASKASLFLQEGDEVDWQHVFTMRNLSTSESVRVVTRVLSDGFAGWVARNKRGDIIADTSNDPRWIVFPNDKTNVGSALCVPFIADDQVVAVITLVHPAVNYFTPSHLRLMTIIANQATIAIRNAQLFTKLSEQRRQLQAILHSFGDVLFVLDRNGHVLMVNETALRLIGLGLYEVLGRRLDNLTSNDTVFDRVSFALQQGLKDDEPAQLSTRSERLQVDYQVVISRWREPLRNLEGFIVLMHDITALRDLNRFKDEMLRIASHDLRNPLALIKSYADMVALDTPEANTDVHGYVQEIRASTERMSHLIDEILRVERIRSSPLELHEQVELEATVKVVVVNMRPSAVNKQQTLEARIALPNSPRMVADPVLLRQAMENLVGNAIKYTRPGGKVTVYATTEGERFIFIVQDTGIGIPPEHQPYVFESFYRVPNTGLTEKGSGLGLSLVKNVVVRHGGEVVLSSEAGKGSRIGFWLPMNRTT